MLYRVIISPRRQHLFRVIKEPLETLRWKTSSLRSGEQCGRACTKPSSSSAPFPGNSGGQRWVSGQGDPGGMPGWAVSSGGGLSAHHPAPGLATALRVMPGDATWVQQPPPGPRAAPAAAAHHRAGKTLQAACKVLPLQANPLRLARAPMTNSTFIKVHLGNTVTSRYIALPMQ